METSLSVVPSGHPDWNESVLAVGKTGYGRVGVDTKIGTRERERERKRERENKKIKEVRKGRKKSIKVIALFFSIILLSLNAIFTFHRFFLTFFE